MYFLPPRYQVAHGSLWQDRVTNLFSHTPFVGTTAQIFHGNRICGPWSFKLNTAYTLLLNVMITSSLKFFYNVSSQINFWLKLKHLSIILFLYLYQHFRVRKLQVYWPLFYITTKTFFLKDQFYYKLMTAHKIQLQNAPHMWNEKWKWWVSNG